MAKEKCDFSEWLDYRAWLEDSKINNLLSSIVLEGAAFEVEFSDRHGRTFESIGLRTEQILVLHFEPASLDLKPEMVTA